ncbi:MAG: HAMP domain-containing protein, partial [Rhodoferax sp.]|nr:HAMP domain-containing protein [Rhodoferax sp.]
MRWPWAVPESHRRPWHRRARTALRHSLRVRLVVVFLLLALGLSLIFLAATQRALDAGWRLAVAPLVADYIDRLVADIGTPPSIERAAALTQRLPVSVRIDGPLVQWRSHPDQDDRSWGHGDGRWHDESPRLLERQTRDGHRIVLGLGDLSWRSQPRVFGMSSLLAVLLVIGLAYLYVRRLLRPIDDIRVGVQRFGHGEFDAPIHVRRRDELGELAEQINTMAAALRHMLDGKRALLLAMSHELRSPLTRARLNTELLPESDETRSSRDALLRDLALMRDLIGDLLESERLSGSHA